MNLLKELLDLDSTLISEDDSIEVKNASEVWAENKEESLIYIPKTIFSVKKDESNEKYHVSVEVGNSRKPFAVLSKLDLDSSFIPVRPNQIPDAEGYSKYRNTDEIQAIKYTGDTIQIESNDETILLHKGDYLIQRPNSSGKFIYEVKKSSNFEAKFEAK